MLFYLDPIWFELGSTFGHVGFILVTLWLHSVHLGRALYANGRVLKRFGGHYVFLEGPGSDGRTPCEKSGDFPLSAMADRS